MVTQVTILSNFRLTLHFLYFGFLICALYRILNCLHRHNGSDNVPCLRFLHFYSLVLSENTVKVLFLKAIQKTSISISAKWMDSDDRRVMEL